MEEDDRCVCVCMYVNRTVLIVREKCYDVYSIKSPAVNVMKCVILSLRVAPMLKFKILTCSLCDMNGHDI